ncbi:hypothetical protein QEW_4011 [Clostridioides difficile CD160]|nr:hypothetical protein QEW_4011 [Clostridioides difficile CD160]
MINDDNIDTYNYINFNFGVGTSYTEEHLKDLIIDWIKNVFTSVA